MEVNRETDLDIVFAIQATSAFTLGVRIETDMTKEEKKQE